MTPFELRKDYKLKFFWDQIEWQPTICLLNLLGFRYYQSHDEQHRSDPRFNTISFEKRLDNDDQHQLKKYTCLTNQRLYIRASLFQHHFNADQTSRAIELELHHESTDNIWYNMQAHAITPDNITVQLVPTINRLIKAWKVVYDS